MMRYVAFATALALLGCGVDRFEESEAVSYRFEVGERPRIEVQIDAGSIEILPSRSAAVEATFRKRVRAFDPEMARRFLAQVEVDATQEGDRVRFRGRSDRNPSVSWSTDLRSELTLFAPRQADLDLRTGDGRIRIEGVEGSILAETGDGRIEVARLKGVLSLRTGDGSIVGRELDGELEATTEDGRIELEGSFRRLRAVSADGSVRVVLREPSHPEDDWVIRTADGSIRLALPAALSAELEAMTSDGAIENRLSGFEGSEGEGYLRGRIGRGGGRIVISTMDGRIELTTR